MPVLVKNMKTIETIACTWHSDMRTVNSCSMRIKPPEEKQTTGSAGFTIDESSNLVCGSGWNEDRSLIGSESKANGQDSSKGVSNTSNSETVQTVYRLTHRELNILGIVLVSSETVECAVSGNVRSTPKATAKNCFRRKNVEHKELHMNSKTLVKLALLIAFLTKVIVFIH